MIIILSASTLISVGASVWLYILKRQAETQEQLVEEQTKREIAQARKDAKKRSGAVIWGKAVEHFVPFTKKFPVPVEDCTFLGMPIDYVAFSNTNSKKDCTVHFIEVKSGNAFLLGKQKNIKRAIEEGRVKWHEISVEGNHIK